MSDETSHQGSPTEGQQDADCVTAALEGDDSAFDTLVRKYHRQAVGVAYRLVSNAQDASDVAQEAFLRAYRSLSSLDDPTRFRAWLLRIVTNQGLNFRRNRGQHQALSLESASEADKGGSMADWLPAGGDGPACGIDARELQQVLRKAIDSLPENQRLALLLFAIEKVPQKEVAEILGCSLELVKWNVFQARKKIKEELADYL